MATGLVELAIVVVLAAILGIIAKLLKQPTILAYIITGAIIAYFGFFHFDNQDVLRAFSDMGIMFLLFLVGLEINYKTVRLVGRESLIGGLAQVVFTALAGFGIAELLGFGWLEAAYIAAALTFSSTIIVVQLLSEKKVMNSLYGKLSIGFLLVQDFVVILLLVALSGVESGAGVSWQSLVLTIIESILLLTVFFFLGRKIFPYIFSKIARSQELLFLSSLAWLFVMVALTKQIGFSIEIGGFLAGLALANSSEHFEISSKIRPLRDFFIVIFFAILGSSVVLMNFSGLFWLIIIFSVFVLIINPIIVLVVMGLMGYERRTSFLSGVTLAQVSEFSFILVVLGLKLGHIGEDIVALIIAVGVITITISTYMIRDAEKIFRFLSPYLGIFEKRRQKIDNLSETDLNKPIILIGCHRTGEALVLSVPKEDLFIVDFDPVVVNKLQRRGYMAVFGDVSDSEIFEKVNFSEARVIISTSPNFDDNLLLINKIREMREQKSGKAIKNAGFPKVIVRAESEKDAQIFYEYKADYVLMPNFISGHYLSQLITEDPNFDILKRLSERDIKLMKKEDIVT